MPLGDPKALVDDIQTMTKTQATHFAKRVLQEYPNMYTFTKALTEHLLSKSPVPTACARLSIVTSAAQDLIPGWVEGKASLNAVALNIGLGVIDSLRVVKDTCPDVVPVDFAANLIIRICAQLLESPRKVIYHLGSSSINPVTWAPFIKVTLKAWRRLPPLKSQLFPPDCQLVESLSDHQERLKLMREFRFHTLLNLLDCKNPRNIARLERAEKKQDKFYMNYDCFTSTTWRFDSTNITRLESSQASRQDILSPAFGVAKFRTLDWTKYFTTFICSLHYFVMKDSTSWPLIKSINPTAIPAKL
ncbi:hypothetical protein DSO57_1009213 [Entomophthora muscae]|uniref:Uncharacterized protein n=1 Tax=Entomophthora muscae TaxID=34485 RepID=A0ACC2SW01_9FUNG|nr:hypothetical protein DSO57_1009213 [Entomophthora muscae]